MMPLHTHNSHHIRCYIYIPAPYLGGPGPDALGSSPQACPSGGTTCQALLAYLPNDSCECVSIVRVVLPNTYNYNASCSP